MLTKDQLEKLIIERLPDVYNPVGMDEIIGAIERSYPTVRNNIENYLQTGEIPDISIEGYSTQQLMTERNMNPIAALLTLSWLAKDPERAKTSLNKGSDFVGRK